jgi:hypothetical protein
MEAIRSATAAIRAASPSMPTVVAKTAQIAAIEAQLGEAFGGPQAEEGLKPC